MAGIPVPNPDEFYAIKKQGRFYAVYERGDQLIWEEGPQEDRLVCVCVYKKGAEEVRRRLVGKVQTRRRDPSQIQASSGVIPEVALDEPLSDFATVSLLRRRECATDPRGGRGDEVDEPA